MLAVTITQGSNSSGNTSIRIITKSNIKPGIGQALVCTDDNNLEFAKIAPTSSHPQRTRPVTSVHQFNKFRELSFHTNS